MAFTFFIFSIKTFTIYLFDPTIFEIIIIVIIRIRIRIRMIIIIIKVMIITLITTLFALNARE